MANKELFNTTRGELPPPADTVNEAGGMAYSMAPDQALAQYAATGCLNHTFYATDAQQLDVVLRLCMAVEPEFIARAALYCRREGRMKDMPALLCAVLSVRSPGLLAEVFDRVIDTPRMLRNFVQIMRSGVVGRKSLGTLPKRLVRQWLAERTDEAIFFASIGRNPSLVDILKMVRPSPETASREALYGYLIGREHDAEALPPIVREYERFKAELARGRAHAAPDVPFQMLTHLPLPTEAWTQIARNAPWQTTRMNLNAYARHGVLRDREMVKLIADRIADPAQVRRAGAMAHQLLMAYSAASSDVPGAILRAIEAAMEFAIERTPAIEGKTWVFVDVSGSMHSPVTGYRRGASARATCVDAASLIASAIVRKNPETEVIAFNESAIDVRLSPSDTVMTNATILAQMPSGGTNCSAPLRELNARNEHADTVIYISDSESWIDSHRSMWNDGTKTMHEWHLLKRRCPNARMVCIDLQPYASSQTPDRQDILNVGGFNDAVFDVIGMFLRGELGNRNWVEVIEKVSI